MMIMIDCYFDWLIVEEEEEERWTIYLFICEMHRSDVNLLLFLFIFFNQNNLKKYKNYFFNLFGLSKNVKDKLKKNFLYFKKLINFLYITKRVDPKNQN